MSAGSPDDPMARALAGLPLLCAEMDPRTADPALLLAEEASALSRCVDKRRREYAAGRLLAGQLLAELGIARAPLLADDQRVPCWPDGVVGCISHTDTWCAVAVGKPLAGKPSLRALGIDVEQGEPLSEQLHSSVCRPEELQMLSQVAAELGGVYAKVIFSAKESIYKALFPKQRQFLGFQGMHIELLLDDAIPVGFEATLMQPWGTLAPGTRFRAGRVHVTAKLICTGIALGG